MKRVSFAILALWTGLLLGACSSTPTPTGDTPITPSTTTAPIPKDGDGNPVVTAFPVEFFNGWHYTVECITTPKGNVTCDWGHEEVK